MDFNEIYSTYHKPVLSFIKYKINDTAIAEELANDVFMRINKHMDSFDENKSKLFTWINNIAKNIIIDYCRNKNIERQVHTTSIQSIVDNDDKEMFQPEDMNLNSLSTMVSNERMAVIMNAIENLPEKYKDITMLYFIEGFSYDQISNELGLKLGTVKGQIFRIRELLKNELKSLVVS